MFNKKNNSSNGFDSQNITTVLAEDCIIEGSITSKAFIKLDGKVTGNIDSAGGVILGQKGFINGDIKTKLLTVYGSIEGDVFTDELIIKSTGKLTGNIHAKSIELEKGGIYNGNINMKETSVTDNINSDLKGKK
ncbi:polymer-forming cytoskeletal protein [Apibacter muscae]|uniref:Polymer-forming cytoskeletal protein n=1 Tax=Apibacter muscae TaxID=2509004 RepID=A0A563DEE5_9FLAO|nr:polymer-forming cytoskeletal protein [Apibacter muscae]TWP23885.1 polymer-forming cytoskeletal protein [Apibacter muscae]TWP28311.1 polymer-forming cytoskeletal protein [Apibacter muscae]TWP30734.1 polymer-forming cytoskeletal protein [Apibacter muscae]